MNTGHHRMGRAIQREALAELSQHPLRPLGLLTGAALTAGVAPLWGGALSWQGWLDSRRRIDAEGPVALGGVLLPTRARALYAEGVWRGLWRVHGLSLALLVVQLPTLLIALLPAGVAYRLFEPTATLFADPRIGLGLAYGVPGLIALMGLTAVGAQLLLTLRQIGEHQGGFAIGLLARMTARSWRAAVAEVGTLVSLALWQVVATLAVGALVYASLRLALLLDLGAGVQLVTTWTAALGLVVLAALTLECLASWAEAVRLDGLQTHSDFSLTRWLTGWLGQVVAWFAARGMVSVGTAVALAVGGLTAVLALISGQTFTSWVGLGWFAATAAVLVVLHVTGRRS